MNACPEIRYVRYENKLQSKLTLEERKKKINENGTLINSLNMSRDVSTHWRGGLVEPRRWFVVVVLE